MDDKRRWARIKVPDSKLSCRITEPQQYAVSSDFPVDNINPGGLCFISDKSIQEKSSIKLQIKFPFTTFEEASSVWGKVTYCLKIHDSKKYVTGIAFIRQK